jgi:hypothetical protein
MRTLENEVQLILFETAQSSIRDDHLYTVRDRRGSEPMLTITYNPELHEADAISLRDAIQKIDPEAVVETHDPGPQAVLEWALPAVIGAVVGGVSAGFFGEAGKDLYTSPKAWIKSAYKAANRSPVYWRGRDKEPTLNPTSTAKDGEERKDEEDAPSKTSPPLKLTLLLSDGRSKLQFVFRKNMTDEEIEGAYNAIPASVGLILSYHEYFALQTKTKIEHAELFRGSMPRASWERMAIENFRHAELQIFGTFVFSRDEGIWIEVF